MVIDRIRLGWLLIAWAFYLVLGSVGLNVPFVVLIIGTIVLLIP